MNEKERTMEIQIKAVEVPRGWYVSRYCLRVELVRRGKDEDLEKTSGDYQILLQFSRKTEFGSAVVWAGSENMKEWHWNVSADVAKVGMRSHYGRKVAQKGAFAQANRALNKLKEGKPMGKPPKKKEICECCNQVIK